MSKQLYQFSISPGDPGHLAAFHFIDGVVEAEPDEIDAITREIDARHFPILDVRPIDVAKIDLAEFRNQIGRGLATYHGEQVMCNTPCPEDIPYIEASVRADFSEGDFDAVMREINSCSMASTDT